MPVGMGIWVGGGDRGGFWLGRGGTRDVVGVHALEELFCLVLVGEGEGDLVVDAPGTDEGVVELFGAVGCHYQDAAFVAGDA